MADRENPASKVQRRVEGEKLHRYYCLDIVATEALVSIECGTGYQGGILASRVHVFQPDDPICLR